jgi:hypothetical protein
MTILTGNGTWPVHWVNLARQWVGTTLNLLSAGCSTPLPLEVARAYEQASLLLADPSMCSVDDATWAILTEILDNYNKGLYSSAGGPPHCDKLEPSSQMLRKREDGPVAITDETQSSVDHTGVDHCCVRNDWTYEEIQAATETATLPCSVDQMLGNNIGVIWLNAWLNQQRCGAIVPQGANFDFLRLSAEPNAICSGSLPDFDKWQAVDETLAEYSAGALSSSGGPCRCNDTLCILGKQQFLSRPASNLKDVIPRAAQWSAMNIVVITTLGAVGTVGWTLFAVTAVALIVVVIVHHRQSIRSRVLKWRKQSPSHSDASVHHSILLDDASTE